MSLHKTAAITLLFAAHSLFADSNFIGQPAPDWDNVFQRTNGWIGADGDYSVQLSDDKILWLFSDTWTGEVIDGKRVKPRMINNSLGIQRGTNPTNASVEYFYRQDKEGNATAFFKPKDERGYFWPFAAVKTSRGLFVFLQRVETYKTGTPFGFRLFETWLAEIKNPDDDPMRWKIKQRKIPFAKFSPNETLLLGAAVLHEKEFVYIYGSQSRTENGKKKSHMIVARVPEEKFADFGKWQFFTDDGWKNSTRNLTPLCPDMPAECSVSWLPALNQYAFVHSVALNGNISIRLAPTVTGPWSEPKQIYQTPESAREGTFCYAGKAHPELSATTNELVITYAANAWGLAQVVNDARLYWPRFVKVNLTELPMD
jgi:hypothetical protein